jgi:thiamine-monophosphate kinase
MKLVKDIGEQGLLQKLQPFFPPGVVGDDGAILDLDPKQKLVVTTDVLVDGVHFSDRTTSPLAVGWRSATANLSDLAAMGATPLGIIVGLALPGELSVAWLEALYQGLNNCLKQYHTPIVGGDITRSATLTVAITAFGQVAPQNIIRRSNARVGDAIIITGYHGLSKAGLELLLNPQLANNLTSQEYELLIQAHQQPNPRLDLLPSLAAISKTTAIAGMDSSDGLADAVSQICSFSGVGAVIDGKKLPIHPILLKLGSLEQATSWTLFGGEDFELVLCLPLPLAASFMNSCRTSATIIGQVNSTEKVIFQPKNDPKPQEISLKNSDFQHF